MKTIIEYLVPRNPQDYCKGRDRIVVTIQYKKHEYPHRNILKVFRHILRIILRCVGLLRCFSDTYIGTRNRYEGVSYPSRLEIPVGQYNIHMTVLPKKNVRSKRDDYESREKSSRPGCLPRKDLGSRL